MRQACVTAVVLLTAACGSNSAAPDARPPDANPPDAMVFVEGAHQLAPQVMSFGGSVIATPVVEPIFFTGDSAMQANIEQFFTDLSTPTSASVWAEMTSEYGVGALTVWRGQRDPLRRVAAFLTARGWPATPTALTQVGQRPRPTRSMRCSFPAERRSRTHRDRVAPPLARTTTSRSTTRSSTPRCRDARRRGRKPFSMNSRRRRCTNWSRR